MNDKAMAVNSSMHGAKYRANGGAVRLTWEMSATGADPQAQCLYEVPYSSGWDTWCNATSNDTHTSW